MQPRELPKDPGRLEAIRRAIAAMPDGLDYFDRLLKDPEMVAVYKADIVQRALDANAEKPPEKRRPEAAVVAHEEWCFSLFGI